MPNSSQWYIPNEVLFQRYWGVITLDDLEKGMLKSKEMIESSSRHLVHCILDVGDVTESLPLADSLKLVRKIGSHPRAGWQITIREKSLLVKMGSSFGRSLLNLRTRTFDSFDEAVAFLHDVDDTIAWENAEPAVIKVIMG